MLCVSAVCAAREKDNQMMTMRKTEREKETKTDKAVRNVNGTQQPPFPPRHSNSRTSSSCPQSTRNMSWLLSEKIGDLDDSRQ